VQTDRSTRSNRTQHIYIPTNILRYDWQRKERLEQALKPITLQQVIHFAKELTDIGRHSMAVWVYGTLYVCVHVCTCVCVVLCVCVCVCEKEYMYILSCMHVHKLLACAYKELTFTGHHFMGVCVSVHTHTHTHTHVRTYSTHASSACTYACMHDGIRTLGLSKSLLKI
jgi:hypothetical protein